MYKSRHCFISIKLIYRIIKKVNVSLSLYFISVRLWVRNKKDINLCTHLYVIKFNTKLQKEHQRNVKLQLKLSNIYLLFYK